jgi:hypothetical protein
MLNRSGVVMAVLRVGSGKKYSTIAAAVAAAKNGDTIEVDAGTYINQYVSINKNIILKGVGGMIEMVATSPIPNGKAIFVTDGDITIENFTFSGARVADRNGAGIRHQTGNLVLNNTGFFNNEMGVMTANSGSGTSLTINNSEFSFNQVAPGYGRIGHNLYAGSIGSLTVDNSYFHDAGVGHQIKSRATSTTITNSRIYDLNGTASYSIDLPNGGEAVIQNNIIEQGPRSQNPTIISFGAEGKLHTGSSLLISGNTIVNNKTSLSSLAVKNVTTATAQITGNTFFGLTAKQIAYGPNTQTGNRFLATKPKLDTTSQLASGTLSINLATDIGSSESDKIIANRALKDTGEAGTRITSGEGSVILGTTVADITGAWTFTLTGLTDDMHRLTASQTDLAGDTGTGALDIILDTQDLYGVN